MRPMTELTPPPTRLLKLAAKVASWSLGLLAAAWLVLAVVWGTLHGWIVPRIGEYRPWLETQASQALGLPVRIGSISAQSTGLIPSFALRDVALLDGPGPHRPAAAAGDGGAVARLAAQARF
jgi:uncharacterized protein YhdP